jgi:hypothetical protein
MDSKVVKIEAFDFSTSWREERSKTNRVWSFQRFIEYSNWDEKFLHCEKWVDRFCWGFILIAVVSLLPVMLHLLNQKYA